MAASRSTRPDPIGSARVPRSAGADGDKPSGQALGNSAKCAAAGIRGHPAVGFVGSEAMANAATSLRQWQSSTDHYRLGPVHAIAIASPTGAPTSPPR
jgi:hypothetical protein